MAPHYLAGNALFDIDNDTAAGLWARIYSFLDTEDMIRGMTVCRLLNGALPGSVRAIDIGQQPRLTAAVSQLHLASLASQFTNLQSLRLLQAPAAPHTEAAVTAGTPVTPAAPATLDFTPLCFPSLRELRLTGVALTSVEFTPMNTPQLQKLEITGARGARSAARLVLDLPHLEEVSISDVRVADCSGLGNGLWLCPKLRVRRYGFQRSSYLRLMTPTKCGARRA